MRSFFYTYFILPWLVFGKTMHALNILYKNARSLPFEPTSAQQLAEMFQQETIPAIQKKYVKTISSLITAKTEITIQEILNTALVEQFQLNVTNEATQSALMRQGNALVQEFAKKQLDNDIKNKLYDIFITKIKTTLTTNPPQSVQSLSNALLEKNLLQVETPQLSNQIQEIVEQTLLSGISKNIISQKQSNIDEQVDILIQQILSKITEDSLPLGIQERLHEQINQKADEYLANDSDMSIKNKANELVSQHIQSLTTNKLTEQTTQKIIQQINENSLKITQDNPNILSPVTNKLLAQLVDAIDVTQLNIDADIKQTINELVQNYAWQKENVIIQPVVNKYINHILQSKEVAAIIDENLTNLVKEKIQENRAIEQYTEPIFEKILANLKLEELDPLLNLHFKTIFQKKLQERLSQFSTDTSFEQMLQFMQTTKT